MTTRQSGFTLIEIVMVLVLLGILSAVAVPKYYDLQAVAEEKAMAAVASEIQARANARFATALLNGAACSAAKTAITTADAEHKVTGTLFDGFTASDNWTVANTGTATAGKQMLSIKRNVNGATANTTKFYYMIPEC